jgi:hypothetical protein
MKESKRYIIALLLVVISLVVLVGYDGKDNKEHDNNRLKSNQTELHYMYTDEEGSFLLDSKASVENVIYVSHADMVNWIGDNYLDELEHGDKMVGTFDDDSLWELVGLDY